MISSPGDGPASSSRSCCLPAKIAKSTDGAFITAGYPRGAGITAVKDKQVMGGLEKGLRRNAQQFLLHLQHVFSRSQTGAVRDPEDVGIYCNGRLSKSGVQNNVGRLTADSRKRLQGFPLRRNTTIVFFKENLAGL